MALAKEDADWTPPSSIIATILNVNRSSKKDKMISPSEIHPFRNRTVKKGIPLRGNFEALKALSGFRSREKGR